MHDWFQCTQLCRLLVLLHLHNLQVPVCSVMQDTKCHIHFPDSNREGMYSEKSNQVCYMLFVRIHLICCGNGRQIFMDQKMCGFSVILLEACSHLII